MLIVLQSGHLFLHRECPLLDNTGQSRILARNGLSANDPKRTWVAHCGNRFNDGFSPYRNARLSRYDVSS